MGTDTSQNNSEIDRNRGIRNAETRFAEHAENRLTSTQLRSPGQRNTREPRTSSQNGTINRKISNSKPADLKRFHQDVRELFAAEGHTIDDSEIREISELKTGHVDKPRFPIFILIVAVLKDSLDVIGTLLVIGVPLTMVASFIMALILFFWTFGKMSGGWWKKRMIRYLLMRYGMTIAIEMVPFVNIIPTMTVFVLLAHFRETKIVKLINLSLEKMHKLGVR